MNISIVFIDRPIATILISIGILFAGILAFNILSVAPLPQIEFPTIIVQSSLPGASPEIMASSIATPLEKQLSKIAGVTEMTSSSSNGSTRIVIQFDLSRDINGAARDVQAAINAANADLPTNLPTHPTYRKVNPADAPFMILALTSKKFKIQEVYDIAYNVIQQKILQINGVGQVIIGGGSLPAIRIESNPLALNKYNISLSDIAKQITNTNLNTALGQLSADGITSIIEINDNLNDVDQYSDLIVKYENDKPIRLSNIAEVKDSVQDVRNAGLLNTEPAIAIIVFKEPAANVIETIERIKSSLTTLGDIIPGGIDIKIILDRTSTIRTSLSDVEKTLLTSIVFVMIVIYFFLNSVRAMLIPTAAMILSLVGTFAIMYLFGFSLNNLSLMALTISTGFVVDDAIVVLENTSRHIERGLRPREAALKAIDEIGFTIISISISLIAVFLPILCMSGIIGRLFHEFAMTLAIAIFVSLLVSISLTPMMCGNYLDAAMFDNKDASYIQKVFNKISMKYQTTLNWALDNTKFMQIITLIVVILSVTLYIIIPKGFFPQQDTGRISGAIVADQDTSFQSLKAKLMKYMDIIKNDPSVENVFGYIGSSSTNSGSVLITLKDFNTRDNADATINRLRSKLANIPGATLFLQSAQDLVIGGRQGNAQFQFTISSDNISDVNNYTSNIMKKLSKLPGIADINSDQRDKGKQVYVKVNYDAAASYNVSMAQVDHTLYSAFGQSLASIIYKDTNQYYVVLEVAPKYWQNPKTLDDMYVKNNLGNLIPLSNIASFEISNTLLSVNHEGLSPAATLSFNLLPNVALGDAINMIQNEVSNMHLPVNIQTTFRGTAQALLVSLSSEPFLILATIIAVYLILGMLYESLIHPLTILSTLPSAGLGALLALYITKTDLTIIALVGIILLIGIVKKNAIMMIDFAIEYRKHVNNDSRQAILNAATLRFRPIMMTTMAALLGALPLVINAGVGSELRKPLGISIIGGLILSQILTLYTVPVIYLSMEKLGNKFKTYKGVTRESFENKI